MATPNFYRPTLEEIRGDDPWTDAEKRVIEKVRHGWVEFGNNVPEESEEAPCIRGPLIRHLMLGGCEEAPVSVAGVNIAGARITGRLDLSDVKADIDLSLQHCRFNQQPSFRDANLNGLYLSGSVTPGVDAQRLRVTGSVQLKDKFQSSGTIDLTTAKIGGQLNCSNATFDGSGDTAIALNAAEIGADLFFRGELFNAKGTVNLIGAKIGGQLDCENANFDGNVEAAIDLENAEIGENVFFRGEAFRATGTVDLGGAKIIGRLSCVNGTLNGNGKTALNLEAADIGADVFLRDGFTTHGLVNLVRAKIRGNLQLRSATIQNHTVQNDNTSPSGLDCEGAEVDGTFEFHSLTKFEGVLDLTDCHVSRLRDDKSAYDGADWLLLTGFRYDRLDSDISVGQRLKWLDKKHETTLKGGEPDNKDHRGFHPQPYTHLAKIYRDVGNANAAARILTERDRRSWNAALMSAKLSTDEDEAVKYRLWTMQIKRPFMTLFDRLFGFGHQPGSVVTPVFAIVLFSTAFFWLAYITNQMAPASDIVLTSPDWIAAVEASNAPIKTWSASATGQDYTTFNAFLYALDLFIPLDALGQEAAWAPSPTRGFFGTLGFALAPAIQLTGWIITAVAAAALAGLIGRKD